MLGRLLRGGFVGLLLGALLAAGLLFGLHLQKFDGASGTVLAYTASALLGGLTGLVAGKPIWASNARLEAGLKAFFGVLLAIAGMAALRRWEAFWMLPEVFGQGRISVPNSPVASLPLIAMALGALFELDNTGEAPGSGDKNAGAPGAPRKRVAAPPPTRGAKSSAARAEDSLSADEGDAASRSTKR